MQQQAALGAQTHAAEDDGGHTIVAAFGDQQRADRRLQHAQRQKGLPRCWRCKSVSEMITPTMMFVYFGFVAVAVICGCWSRGAIPSATRRLYPVRRPVLHAHHAAERHREHDPVDGRRRRQRVFELLDETEGDNRRPSTRPPVITETARRGAVRRVRFRYKDDVPLIEDLSLRAEARPDDHYRWSDRRGKTTLAMFRRTAVYARPAYGGSIRVDGARICHSGRSALGVCSAWCCRTRGSLECDPREHRLRTRWGEATRTSWQVRKRRRRITSSVCCRNDDMPIQTSR